MQQIIWEDVSRPCGDDEVTKSRNRKLIRVTSSNEGLKHMCVDLSDYIRYLNQIWYKNKYRTINTPEWPNSHKLKNMMTKFFRGIAPLEWAFVSSPTTSPNKSTMVDGGHIEFRKQNANISVIDDDNEG